MQNESCATPICDFVQSYAEKNRIRLHMPGHEGRRSFLGCEPYDITEISGADTLYEANGIIAESERIASGLFGSGRTLYSTEGSSQCIRAMVHLAVTCRRPQAAPVLVAARNVHRAFLYACALTDADVVWIYPSEDTASVMSCPVTSSQLEETLSSLDTPCCGVYLTSPDYLGQMQDLSALARICHAYNTPLLVDNAHGACLHFLPEEEGKPLHPLDLGADLCCDSAHKTLPVLTGGAYLHISKNAPSVFAERAKAAMALHGSTSPSYLTLCSLDQCNLYLTGQSHPMPFQDQHLLPALKKNRKKLREAGFSVVDGDPLHLSLFCDGICAGNVLREGGIEPEYAGPDALVLLFSPTDPASYVCHAADILASAPAEIRKTASFQTGTAKAEKVTRIREAVFSEWEIIPAALSPGRAAAMPTASCPPAVPPVMPGERISKAAAEIFSFYGYDRVSVIKDL